MEVPATAKVVDTVARWYILIQDLQFWYNLGGLGMENFNVFHDHWLFFVVTGFIL
jgi:hypothetical protein